MTAHKSRLLVIDASVVRSAGETNHPVSSACRDVLLAVLSICHQVALTKPILDEWKKHMSRFSRKWRRSMEARRKVRRDVHPDQVRIDTRSLNVSDKQEIEKDRCLLEAAGAGDGIIITLDRELQDLLCKADPALYMSITWVDPVKDGAGRLECL